MEKRLKTLQELTDIINTSDDYPCNLVTDTIEANGWNDEQHETFGVCSTETERIVMNENGFAVVIDK